MASKGNHNMETSKIYSKIELIEKYLKREDIYKAQRELKIIKKLIKYSMMRKEA